MDVSAFSMRNATLAALSLWLRSPHKMEVGALVRDPVKNVYATIYAHAQSGYSHNLGGDIESPHFSMNGQSYPGVYSGGHLFTMPWVIPDGSAMWVKNEAVLQGPLCAQADLSFGSLVLNAEGGGPRGGGAQGAVIPVGTLCEGKATLSSGTLRVEKDVALSNSVVTLRPVMGNLSFV